MIIVKQESEWIDRAQIVCHTAITILVLTFGFLLFWFGRGDGGAYFLGVISGSPALALAARAGKAVAAKAKVQTDDGETAEVQNVA